MSSSNNASSSEDIQAFRNFAQSCGYNLPMEFPFGEIIRFQLDNRDKKASGWFIAYQNQSSAGRSFITGVVGDWKSGRSQKYLPNGRLNPEEKIRVDEHFAQARQKFDSSRAILNEQARKASLDKWSVAAASGSSAYLKKKGLVKSPGLRFLRTDRGIELLVPMYDENNDLWGIQRIFEDGSKRFMYGQRTKGLYFQIGDIESKIFVCEGIATALSVHEATGEAVVCAFNAGNLVAVSKIIREKYPDLPIIIPADNDQWTEGNPGIAAARNAAIEAQCVFVTPNFKSTVSKPTDFNDLHQLEGLKAVKSQLSNLDKRPSVLTSDKQWREVLLESWRGLQLRGLFNMGLFRGTDSLVRLVTEKDGDKKIDPVSVDYLHGELIDQLDWYCATKDGYVPTRPPVQLARIMVSRPAKNLPLLQSVVRCPFVTKTGQLIFTPGYHSKYGLYLNSDIGDRIEAVPEFPNSDDIEWAKKIIRQEMLGDFPFVSPADEAHAIAAALQQFVRDEVIDGPSPMYGIEAPTPGSGKGLLADLISEVATGRSAQPTTLPEDENETRKKITSLLVASPSVILIDNARTDKIIDSSALASVLTTTRWRDRLLGFSRMATSPNLALWLLTANNPRYSFEIARRTVRSRLDPNIERPWRRMSASFRHPNIRRWTKNNRHHIVRAFLVLIRNWFAKGCPESSEQLGSFESWSNVIGGILGAAEIPGFLENLEHMYEYADSESIEWEPFILAWWKDFGDRNVSPSDLHKLCKRLDLLQDILGAHNERSAKTKLGIELKAKSGRVFCRYKIEIAHDGGRHKGRQYRLAPMAETNTSSQPEGDIGDVRTSSSTPETNNVKESMFEDFMEREEWETCIEVPTVPDVPKDTSTSGDVAVEEDIL